MNRILLIVLVVILTACGDTKKEASGPVIAVSIIPQEYLVKSIVDTLVDVHVMVPPGASPATWEATPSEMQSLSDALVYYRIGHIGFEKAWISDIEDINPGLRVVDLSMSLELRSMEYQHGDHKHSGVDPHTWMSPANMEIMARKIFEDMLILFPEHKDMLRKNYSELLGEIKQSDRYADKMLAEYSGKSFLIFHPSLGYFADAYGLNQMSIEFEGKEPSPSHMKAVIDQAKQAGINIIFVQKEFDVRNAEIIADEIGARIVMVDPLSPLWPKSMKQLVNSLKDSFDE